MSETTAPAVTAATSTPLTALSSITGEQPAAPAAAPAVAPDASTEPAATEPAADEALTVKLPGKDATPEQWAEFYKQIGAPDKAEAYELPLPEGDSGDFAKTASEWFKEAGLLPQQAKALATKWNEFSLAQQKAVEAQEQARIQALDTKNKAEEVALRTEWGQKHDANLELARRAARQFIPQDKLSDVVTALEDRLGYSETIKLLHKIGAGLGEHDAPGLGQQTGGGRKSIAEVLYGGTSSPSNA